MKKYPVLLTLLFCAAAVLGSDEPRIPPMPAAVSSNAVASLQGGLELFSMMGVGPKKSWDDVTNRTFIMRLSSGKWSEGKPVPGVAGRLGAAAAGAKGQIILMGGYVVDNQGTGIIVPDVNVYVPSDRRWYRAKDLPVPVGNAIAGVNHNRFVYLVGGLSPNGPVNNVQVYDAEKDTWSQATPFPGTPVFGLAGGLADDTIVVVDGAKTGPAGGQRYVTSDECWLGKIDHKDPAKIEWSKLPAHPGTARFGIVATGSDREKKILFSGGTAVLHNYKGVGYDGKPVAASPVTFAYEVHHNRWETISEDTTYPRISGGLVDTPVGPMILGGMVGNQAVTAGVTLLPKK
ncbi:MAG: kelch repeat-containing protein [Candidatus Sulfotelmatobacter sp.]